MGPNLCCYLLLDGYNTRNFTVRLKNNTLFQKLFLAVGLDLTVAAAVEELGVVGSATAAGSVTVESLEWESVGVATAARLLTADALHAWLDWATGVSAWVKIGVVVSVLVVSDRRARDEKGEQVVNKDTLDGASSCGTRIIWVVGLA